MPKSMTIAFLAVSLSLLALNVDFVDAKRSAPAPMVTLTPEEQAWLAKHPEIVLGASTDYPPMVIKRSDGTHVGVLVDLFEQISLSLNTRVRLHVEDSWADIQKKAQNREIDGLSFGARDPSRDAIYNATDIVMPTYFSVFGRSRYEYHIKRFSDLNGMRIGYKKGARPTRSLLEKLPSAILVPRDSHESLTQALLSREIDVVVAWMSYDHWRKDKMQGTIDNILLIEEYPIEQVIYVRNDWPVLIPILNKALAALQKDELPRLINKWFGDWPQSYAKRVAFTQEEKDWLKAHQVVTIAYPGDYGPYSFKDQDGEFRGISVDLVNEVARQAGLKLKTYPDGNWTNLYSAAQQHEVDVIGGIIKRPERDQWFEFTKPYLSTEQYIVTRREQTDIQQRKDITSKTLALVRGYATTKTLLEEFPDVKAPFTPKRTNCCGPCLCAVL